MDGWTLRLTAAALLTLCGAAGGHSLASSRRLRVVQLESLLVGIGRLTVQMLEKMLPLKEALMASSCEAIAPVAANMTGGRMPLDAYLGAVQGLSARGGALSALTEEDTQVLEKMFEGLGASGASEQRLLLTGVQAQLDRLSQAARKTAEEQAKLYTSLGLISGLALSVCLL